MGMKITESGFPRHNRDEGHLPSTTELSDFRTRPRSGSLWRSSENSQCWKIENRPSALFQFCEGDGAGLSWIGKTAGRLGLSGRKGSIG
jgi:hypothetical protein